MKDAPTNKNALADVSRGGLIFIGGRTGNALMQFILGLVLIRVISPAEFGLLGFGNSLMSFFVIISTLGFISGLPRFIAKYRTRQSDERIAQTVWSSLIITVLVSGLVCLLLIALSGQLSRLCSKPGLKQVLTLLPLTIPPIAICQCFTAIYRGYEKTGPKVIFQDLGTPAIRLALVLVFLAMGITFNDVLLIYLSSAWILLGLYIFFVGKHRLLRFPPRFDRRLSGQLLLFSLPLLGIGPVNMVMNWAATWVLGLTRPAEEIGFYVSAFLLANMINIPLNGMMYIFLPVSTSLHDLNENQALKELFTQATKWSFLLVFPFVFFFLTRAPFMVTLCFGPNYADAANILIYLAAGYGMLSLFGPNTTALVSIGNTGAVLISSLLGAATVILLCLLLTPIYGSLGAAMATALSMIVSGAVRAVFLFSRHGIHPFHRQFLVPVVLTALVSVLFLVFTDLLFGSNIYGNALLFAAVFACSVGSPLITGHVGQDEVALLKQLEFRIHKKEIFTAKLEKILNRRKPVSFPE